MTSIAQIKETLKQIESKKDIPQEWLEDERKGVVAALKAWERQQDVKQQQYQQLEALKQLELELMAKGYHMIAGIDEVGRGCLAGPVLAACVIMPKDSHILGVNDSKQLSVQKRDMLYDLIMSQAIAVGIGMVDSTMIDKINIYEATKVAMQKAIDNMAVNPEYLLIDAMSLTNDIPQLSLIKGDSKSYSIACASIVAKVTRDRLMSEYAKEYPYYGFDKNAGYGTKEHLLGVDKYGITPIHRQSFEPIKSIVQ